MSEILNNKLFDQTPYDIFNIIPHRRVKQFNKHEEIFDLYQLGTFKVNESILSTLIPKISDEKQIKEQVELVELQSNARYMPHFHKNSAAVIYIIQGSGEFILGKEKIRYQHSQRIIIPAGTLHGFCTDTRTLFLSIQCPPIIDEQSGNIDLYYGDENGH